MLNQKCGRGLSPVALTSCGAGELVLRLWEYSIALARLSACYSHIASNTRTCANSARAAARDCTGRDALGTYAAGRSRSRLFFLL